MRAKRLIIEPQHVLEYAAANYPEEVPADAILGPAIMDAQKRFVVLVSHDDFEDCDARQGLPVIELLGGGG